MAENGTLSTKQQKALVALLAARTIQEAAATAEVGERTLRRWLSTDETFKATLIQAEGELLDTAARRLLNYTDAALTVLAMLMAEKTQPPTVRLGAARAILDATLQFRGLRSVEQRLTALEAALSQGQGKGNDNSTTAPPPDAAGS